MPKGARTMCAFDGPDTVSIGQQVLMRSTRETTDVISVKPINAEENAFDFGALAFTGNTVRGARAAVAA
jgi:hypothetical protein